MAFFLLFNSFIGNATEQTMGPNTTLQLIDDIRAKVHAADLLAAFRSRGIRDAADLVALSGARTPSAGPSALSSRTAPTERRTTSPGSSSLKADCYRDPNRLQ